MSKYHKTVGDLVEFHSIRKSWDLNEEVLKEVGTKREGSPVVGVGDDVEDIEEEDIEGVTSEEVEEGDIDDVDEEDILNRLSAMARGNLTFSLLTNNRSLPHVRCKHRVR